MNAYTYRILHGGANGYEFYLQVMKTIFDELAQRVSKILFSPPSVYSIVVNNLKPNSLILIFDQQW